MTLHEQSTSALRVSGRALMVAVLLGGPYAWAVGPLLIVAVTMGGLEGARQRGKIIMIMLTRGEGATSLGGDPVAPSAVT